MNDYQTLTLVTALIAGRDGNVHQAAERALMIQQAVREAQRREHQRQYGS